MGGEEDNQPKYEPYQFRAVRRRGDAGGTEVRSPHPLLQTAFLDVQAANIGDPLLSRIFQWPSDILARLLIRDKTPDGKDVAAMIKNKKNPRSPAT